MGSETARAIAQADVHDALFEETARRIVAALKARALAPESPR
jgi:hypothetical protein